MTAIKPWLLLAVISTALILPVQGVIALERAPDQNVHYYPRTNAPTNSGITNPGGNPSGSWSNSPSNHWVNGPSWHHRPGYWRYPSGSWRGRWGYWGGWRGYWGPPPRYYWGSSCWDCGIGSALVGLTFGGIAPPVIVNSLPPPPPLPLPEPLIERDTYEGCQSITVKGIPYYNCEGRDNRNRDRHRRYEDDRYSDRADNAYQQEDQDRYDQRYEDDAYQNGLDNGEAPYRNNPFSRTLPYDNHGWEAK